ncbi:YncE family protein [Streptomyces sp. KR80]|uniref:YncE family protein n=1 Tax=Streptomyces sp. KR80 TaxID=3457426 RepID=UPI003FCF8F20
MRRATAVLAATLLAVVTNQTVQASAGAAPTSTVSTAASGERKVMYVGNNWDGTADVIDAKSFTKIKRLNVIPDKAERLAEIYLNPVRLAFFLAIREAVGEGHDQYVDDMFSTRDGRLLAVSRPSFADVVGIDLSSGKIVWRFAMHGQRADHMNVSPDGTRLLVSDSTANHVDELDIETGRRLRQFESGDTPHESNYSKDGSRIFHASIGRIYTPTDPSQFCPFSDPTKGDQRFQVVDNASFDILKKWDIGQALKDAGFPCMSSAVRPMAISPDEKTAYLQISFFHGYVVFDLERGVVTEVVRLPQSEHAKSLRKSQYVLNSAHHGLAINADGTQLCVAGTMDDYVGLVDIANPTDRKLFTLPHIEDRPYWATNGPGDQHCWVSIAGDDRVNVYDYAGRSPVASIQVGDHPQRVRVGTVSRDVLSTWQDVN